MSGNYRAMNDSPFLENRAIDIERELADLKNREARLLQYRDNYETVPQQQQAVAVKKDVVSKTPLWDAIEKELQPLTDEQVNRIFSDDNYAATGVELQQLISAETVNLVKVKIENTEYGKELLNKQYRLLKDLKDKVVNETNHEMELFKKFRNFSASNPGITYEEFIKTLNDNQ